MDKSEIIKSVTQTHKEVTEQTALVNGFLMAFNKSGKPLDTTAVVEFFNKVMVRHFMKEDIIFGALLKVNTLDPKLVEVVKATIKEHDMFMDEFRELTESAARIDKGEEELSLEYIKKCQFIIWGLSKHAQVEDLVIFPEVAQKLSDHSFKLLESEFSKS